MFLEFSEKIMPDESTAVVIRMHEFDEKFSVGLRIRCGNENTVVFFVLISYDSDHQIFTKVIFDFVAAILMVICVASYFCILVIVWQIV